MTHPGILRFIVSLTDYTNSPNIMNPREVSKHHFVLLSWSQAAFFCVECVITLSLMGHALFYALCKNSTYEAAF